MKRSLLVAVTMLTLMAMALPAKAAAYPPVIDLPDGFRPEGIAVGPGHTFYAGSLGDGTIVAGDFRTGDNEALVPGQEGWMAVGMSFDARSGNLFVAGGLNGVGRVFDTQSGDLLAEYPMADSGPAAFINDVIVTRTAAYFTDSFAPVLYRVPLDPNGRLPNAAAVEAVPLSGDWVQIPGPFVFNANGIDATPNGKSLIVVSSAGAAVYRVDPDTGEASEIDLGGMALPNGDGLVLNGRTLYVVQNQTNQIGVISLAPDLGSGDVGTPITHPEFDIPTTAARFGSSLYVVNARFGTPPTSSTSYTVVEVGLP